MVLFNWLGRLASGLFKLAKRRGWSEKRLADATSCEKLLARRGD